MEQITENKSKEARLRRKLNKTGHRLIKSRVKNIHLDDLGGYMIVDYYNNAVVVGVKFELSLEDVEYWATELEKKN